MDFKAQVSLEYLLTTLFVIGLAIAAAMLIGTIQTIALNAQAKIQAIRDSTISSLLA